MILNPYRYVTGGGGGTTVTWNPADIAADLTLSNSDLTVTRDGTNNLNWRMVRANLSRNSGKYCFVVTNVVGTSDGMLPGLVNGSATLNNHVGFTAGGYGIHNANGRCYNNNAQVGGDIGNATSAGDGYSYAVDFAAGKIWVGRYVSGSNTWSGDPAAGTGERFTFTAGTALFPGNSLYRSTHSALGRFKSADIPFTIPAGFSAWE